MLIRKTAAEKTAYIQVECTVIALDARDVITTSSIASERKDWEGEWDHEL